MRELYIMKAFGGKLQGVCYAIVTPQIQLLAQRFACEPGDRQLNMIAHAPAFFEVPAEAPR